MSDSIDTLIARVLRLPPAQLTDDLEFQSIPQWDSLTHVDLMLALEKEFALELDGDQVLALHSIGALRQFAQEHAPRSPGPAAAERPSGPTPVPPQADKPKIQRGLNGVLLDRSRITLIDGDTGRLLYRGYSIHDLAEKSTFEETAYLLVNGELPTAAQLGRFDSELRAARDLPPAVFDLIRGLQHAHPMAVLRTAVSALAGWDADPSDASVATALRQGLRLTAQTPTIITAHLAFRAGRDPVLPDPALPHAANFLYMLSGRRPDDASARWIDRDFILHADHGSNASAFAARVAASTGAGMHAALTAAMAAFAGPTHGGAAERILSMVEEIGSPDRAVDYVQTCRAHGRPVMGFGHRVYRTEDPRVRHFREAVRALCAQRGEPECWPTLEAIVAAMRPYARHGIHVNVDFYAGMLYHLLGIPQDLSVSMFVLGRMAGWVVQVIEQLQHNILIRPLLLYTGARERPYSSIRERS